jgi:hypothetical protein
MGMMIVGIMMRVMRMRMRMMMKLLRRGRPDRRTHTQPRHILITLFAQSWNVVIMLFVGWLASRAE